MKLNYKTKILITLLSISGIIFLGGISFYYVRFKKIAHSEAQKKVDAYVRENANKISAEFNTDIGVCRALAATMASKQKFHEKKKWPEYLNEIAETDKQSEGLLNVWASYELKYYQKGYKKSYGRRTLEAYTIEGKQQTNNYFKNLEGDDIGSSYHNIKLSKKETAIEPYLYSLSGKVEDEQLVTSLCMPILDGDNFMGLAGVDIGLERYQQLTDNIKPYDGSYSFLVAYDGRIITHPNKELINKTFQDSFSEINNMKQSFENIQAGKNFSYTIDIDGKVYYSYAPIIIGKTETPWSLVTVTPEKDMFAEAGNILSLTLILGALGFSILGVVIWLVVSSFSNTIQKFISFTNQVNNGDLTTEIQLNRNDELGELAVSLQNMGASLREIVNQLKFSSQNISEASDLLNDNSQKISFSASKQAAEVEEISSALEQMVTFIDQNAANSKATEDIAIQSKNGILNGTEASVKATQSMQEVANKNHLISDIAFQTNILALNAAVEAARAGEEGKGFSVVASEVRKLAERSKQAADEITQLSDAILSDSLDAHNKLSTVLPEIEKTTNLVQDIASSSKEQAVGVNQINISIHQLNDITQDNAGSAENLAASAEELSAQAEQLKELVGAFIS